MAAEAMRAALADFTPDWAEVVALVKQHGEEVAAVRAGADEDTPLHSAAYWGATEAVDVLIGVGADVNARNRQSSTPLHLCALNGQAGAAKLLVEKGGADLSLADEHGLPPLHTACSIGDAATAAALLALGADAAGGVRGNGNSACHVACREGHLGVVEMLLEKVGSERVVRMVNDAHEGPLHRAAAHGQKEIVRCLVEAGADVTAVDSNGDTSLHLAAMFGMSETAAELVALGAPLDAVDEDEQTPLHLAVMADQADTACVLLKLGADAERKNEEGQSPRELCTSKGLQAVLEAMPA